MFRMPISGIDVELRHATGMEDLLMLEGGDSVSIAMELAERLAVPSGGGSLDAARLPVPDLEALLLEVRRMALGDTVASRGKCPAEDCAAPIDITFRISDYLRNHNTRRPANVEELQSEPSWYQLKGGGVQFRLVTACDLAAAANSQDPERELARRTIRTEDEKGWKHDYRKAQRAMESLAPSLSGEIEGRCPECGSDVRFWFDVQSYVQRELRYDAEFLFEDVHQLATHYHWSEEKILSLPRQRRMQYVEMTLRGAEAAR